MFGLQTVVVPLTRASMAIRVVNRAGVAHVSKETNYDVTIVCSPVGSSTPILQAPLCLHYLKAPQRGTHLRTALHTSSRARSSGMSGSTMPWLRQEILGRPARTQAPPDLPLIAGGHGGGDQSFRPLPLAGRASIACWKPATDSRAGAANLIARQPRPVPATVAEPD